MTPPEVAAIAAGAQRQHWGRVLAATLRLARDVDIAEEATADAFVLALETWPQRGVPESVEAWLLTVARRRAIDRIRRAASLRTRLEVLAATGEGLADGADAALDRPVVPDDELRLVVLCCHPALAQETQVALTLRLACGVPTAAIAAAFLVAEPTMAARLTRAKRRIADSGTGIDLPDDLAVEERMPAVRRTLHLAYTMGHTAGTGGDLRDDDLVAHAERLARALHRARPDDSEAAGLLALVLFTEARRTTRLEDGAGVAGQVVLGAADRSRWDRGMIAEGLDLLGSVRSDRLTPAGCGGQYGVLVLQAAIAAEHTTASSVDETDWGYVVRLYDALLAREPSSTVAIGRCLALSHLLGPEAGLQDLEEVTAIGGLERYPYAHAARADLLERTGRRQEAETAWHTAETTARTDAEREYFQTRAVRASAASERTTSGRGSSH